MAAKIKPGLESFLQDKEELKLNIWRRNFAIGCGIVNGIVGPTYLVNENYHNGAIFTLLALGCAYMAYESNYAIKGKR